MSGLVACLDTLAGFRGLPKTAFKNVITGQVTNQETPERHMCVCVCACVCVCEWERERDLWSCQNQRRKGGCGMKHLRTEKQILVWDPKKKETVWICGKNTFEDVVILVAYEGPD
jgi:hypothetical protein